MAFKINGGGPGDLDQFVFDSAATQLNLTPTAASLIQRAAENVGADVTTTLSVNGTMDYTIRVIQSGATTLSFGVNGSGTVTVNTVASGPSEWDGKTAFYVRQGATGNGSGSDWTNAYTDLPPSLQRGAVYYIADGLYSSYTFSDPEIGSQKIYIVKATEADHGPASDWQSSYGDGQAEINSQYAFATGYYHVDGQVGGGPAIWGTGSDDDGSSYGFRLFSNATTDDQGKRIRITGDITSLTVKHCDLSYDGTDQLPYPSPDATGRQDAIYGLANPSDIYFGYCRINSPGRTAFLSNGNWTNLTFEYNFFRKSSVATWSGMHGEIMSVSQVGSTTNFVFRHNYIWKSQSTGGLIISGGDGVYVYGNVWYECNGSNGLVSNWTEDTSQTGDKDPTVNVFVYNNSFIDSDVGIGWSSMSDVNSRNNAFYNCTYNWSASNHDYSFTDTSIGESNEQVYVGNPFVNTSAALPDMHLSQSTNAGVALSSPYNVDMDGVTRGSDGNWDRGAFEYTA